jgi:hypothetical protein
LTYAPLERRRAEVERLFLDPANYCTICESITEDRSIRTLFVMVFGERTWTINIADEAVQGVARHLDEYTGSIDNSVFLSWAKTIAHAAAIRLSQFYSLIEKHKADIRAGIRAALPPWNFFDDSGALIEEIFQEVAMLVMADLDSFLRPGTATLETRLYALARWHTMGYYTLKFRRRQDALERHIMGGGVIGRSEEVFSGTELASIKTDETGRYHAPVDYLRTIRARRQAAEQDEVASGNLGRMLCPTGCGLQTIAEISDGISHLSCGHVRGVQIEAAV